MANRSSTDTNIDRRGKDMMGYPLTRQLKGYTDLDIEAARVLAKEAGYEWDCVYTDPAVTGKRFLKSARIVRQFLEDQAMLHLEAAKKLLKEVMPLLEDQGYLPEVRKIRAVLKEIERHHAVHHKVVATITDELEKKTGGPAAGA